jgi:hypothetical protein
MSAPFIFIATNRLREGKLAAERDRVADLGSFIEANEPQLLAFNEYVNEDGTEVGVVQIHPNAASMEFHMGVVAERAARAYADTLAATASIQVYGEPSDAVLEMLRRQAGAARALLSCHDETPAVPRQRPPMRGTRAAQARAQESRFQRLRRLSQRTAARGERLPIRALRDGRRRGSRGSLCRNSRCPAGVAPSSRPSQHAQP